MLVQKKDWLMHFCVVNAVTHKDAYPLGIDTLCRHNFEHNRYIWEFENNARIIGNIGNILGIMLRFPVHVEGFSVHLL